MWNELETIKNEWESEVLKLHEQEMKRMENITDKRSNKEMVSKRIIASNHNYWYKEGNSSGNKVWSYTNSEQS